MKYDNSKVRRQDRLLEEPQAIELLLTAEFGILSMAESIDGQCCGYGIPINYAWDAGDAIYFHCAPDGHKLECLTANPCASFCVVGRTNVISNKFTTEYESVIVRGTTRIELSAEERMQALELILDKYSPRDKEMGLKYAEKSFHRTAIIRLDISTISGKKKRV